MGEGHLLWVCISIARSGVTKFIHQEVQRKNKNRLIREMKTSQVFLCCINWYEGMLHTHFKLKLTTKETARVCYPVHYHNCKLTK